MKEKVKALRVVDPQRTVLSEGSGFLTETGTSYVLITPKGWLELNGTLAPTLLSKLAKREEVEAEWDETGFILEGGLVGGPPRIDPPMEDIVPPEAAKEASLEEADIQRHGDVPQAPSPEMGAAQGEGLANAQ